MSAEIKKETVEAEVPQVILMPQTPEQLKAFIAGSVTDVLNIPENATQIARVVIAAALRSLSNDAQHEAIKKTRPVLTRTPYAGCLRAVITANEVASDEPLTVDVMVHDIASDSWVESGLPQAGLENVAKLVLSQATVPGDVWYITTNHAVDKQLDAATDALLQQAHSNADPV